jgi:hypothetical protein
MARERASLLFDRGENWLVMKEYAQAQIVFEEMLEEAKICGWQRSMVHAQNWLAYSALLQNNLVLSRQYLWTGWPVATRIKEKRLIAYYKRTFAYYYQATHCETEAIQWAEAALDSFQRLGMPPDMQEMKTLIALWSNSAADTRQI